jgi:UDP-N-acetylmuramyl pentapeptide synthase
MRSLGAKRGFIAHGRKRRRCGLIVGVRKLVVDGAREAGVEDDRLRFAADAVQAGELLARTVKSGDVVLIKGSRGVKLEQALNTLRAAFSSMEP